MSDTKSCAFVTASASRAARAGMSTPSPVDRTKTDSCTESKAQRIGAGTPRGGVAMGSDWVEIEPHVAPAPAPSHFSPAPMGGLLGMHTSVVLHCPLATGRPAYRSPSCEPAGRPSSLSTCCGQAGQPASRSACCRSAGRPTSLSACCRSASRPASRSACC